jgi:hypothetical protein
MTARELTAFLKYLASITRDLTKGLKRRLTVNGFNVYEFTSELWMDAGYWPKDTKLNYFSVGL